MTHLIFSLERFFGDRLSFTEDFLYSLLFHMGSCELEISILRGKYNFYGRIWRSFRLVQRLVATVNIILVV